ncbi:MAG TPA: flagellar M-ring protein FliF C-terminal domain-containing protein [Planctomycetota bacterium]
MKDQLDKLLAGLKGTNGATRLIAALVGLALVAIAGLAAVVANRPHFELAFSGLTDHELAQVGKALAEAGIPFEQSQPPGPFVVYVDRDRRSSAYMAVYAAGALDKPLEGILAGGGVASVFESAEERAQGVRKREWQEMEKMLEELDFVAGARVRTSATPSSGLGTQAAPPTASVTLRVAGEAELAPAQSQTVANLVSRGLGIDKRHLVVSDQAGRALYDGERESTERRDVGDLLAHQAEHDRRLAREANAVLEAILGPNKARVTVSSEWDHATSTLRKDTPAKGAVLQESKTTSEKPLAGTDAPAAGVSANTLDPDAPGARPAGALAQAPALEKTSEETKSYAPTLTSEERVRTLPELKRLSVALFLDQSVQPQGDSLERAIQAAVGFDEERRDEFRTVVLPFVVAPAPAEGAPAAADVPVRPDPLLETLLRRGVEIAAAVVFLLLLARTLRGPRKERRAGAGGSAGAEEIDAELLARARVDELLKSDPAKVGEILSRWAREEPVASR